MQSKTLAWTLFVIILLVTSSISLWFTESIEVEHQSTERERLHNKSTEEVTQKLTQNSTARDTHIRARVADNRTASATQNRTHVSARSTQGLLRTYQWSA